MKAVFTPNRGVTASLMWGASVLTLVAWLFVPLAWRVPGAYDDIQDHLQQRERILNDLSSGE